MKKYLFLILLLPGWVFAQNRQIVETASGDDLSGKVSTTMQYLFPEFSIGEVYFFNAPKGSGMLNYNMLVGEMQFMDNNEVLGIANVKDVAMVNINNRRFYPFNNRGEFTEELFSTDQLQLRIRRKGNVAPFAKKGAYGTSSSTSSITSYSSVNSGDRQYNLSVASDVIISLRTFYYLVGTNGKLTQITNVKAFTKQYPAHRARIEAFAKERNIRFDREADLKALLVYCSEL
jgi:hypothetical protein